MRNIPLLLFCALSHGQTPVQPGAEMTTKDAPATFSAKSNLVLVRVVVHDQKSHAIGTLHKEDFQLFDKNKPQTISKFSVENTNSHPVVTVSPENAAEQPPGSPPPPALADRFVAYLFDDVHLKFGDLAQVRSAAERHLAEIPATTRAAIYTTSGQTMLDFTDDVAKLRDALSKIQPRSRSAATGLECPDVTYYQADLIQNRHDPTALQAAVLEALACASLDPKTMMSVATSMAQSAASRVLAFGDMETRLALGTLKDVVRRISAMPGQRSVVLVSPGYLVLNEHRFEEMEILDRAVRSNVTISSIDARGLYVLIPGGDASQRTISTAAAQTKGQLQRESASAEANVLAELADGTSGKFFQNSNDLLEGFKRVASLPEFYYVLGFSPQNLKYDGSYHALKVTLKESRGLTLQARRGYVAPKHELDPALEAKREMEEALFSREEMREIPIDLHTQFFKLSSVNAKLAVLARIDLKHLRFRKGDGRNYNTLTIIAGLFDRNGNYISAVQKNVEMRLKDETLDVRLANGITIRNNFDVTPGSYVLRLVVRDAEGQMMAALNGAVEIP